MRRYIDTDLLKDKTTRVNNIWNSTTNAEGKGLDEIIDDIPTADVRENIRGEWIDYSDEGYIECPFCHSATNCEGNKDELHYCFSCGAELR